MRIKVTFSSDRSGTIDFNYQHQIQAVIYGFLAKSDPDYAAWLHEQGFIYKKDKRFKLFVYSGLSFHGPVKIKGSSRSNCSSSSIGLNSLNGFSFNGSQSNPFIISLQIASPVDRFIQHLIDGIFKKGTEIVLGRQNIYVYTVETLPNPLSDLDGHNGLSLKPLESPVFVKKPMPSGEKDIYLFPEDKEYTYFLNQNLIHKYETLYDKVYQGEVLKFQFYSIKGKKEKSFKIYKNGQITEEIKGTLQPFTVSGYPDLIRIGLDCGFGQNNSMGCGYVEVIKAD